MIKRRALIFLIFAMMVAAGGAGEAKLSDLAGSWYSASPSALRSQIETYLKNAAIGNINGVILGVIAPHAGLRFSGPIMAYAYKAVEEKSPDKVIVVGFTHRRYFPDRIAVFTDDAFVTPLGRARIDKDITDKLLAYSENIQEIPQAFVSENSIEMQIPFIQVAAEEAQLVLVALCDQRLQNCRLLADALYEVLRDEKNFVLIASTDMCHYLPHDETNVIDNRTIAGIKALDPDLFYFDSLNKKHELLCGYGATYAVMSACKRLGANEVKVLKYANSGDITGDKKKVVGYMSAVFVDTGKKEKVKVEVKQKGEDSMFNQAQRKELLRTARDTIRYYLETGKRLQPVLQDETLMQDMGAFVTLHKSGQLRGCIGHMAATGPIFLTVRDMAIAAATEDPRFPPVTLDELEDIDIEISALSPMEKIDDYNGIKMGKHGVMVRKGFASGVYLPQVADETGWDREQFMNSLCAHKAGIPPDSWKRGTCDIYVFTAEVFGEKDE